MPADPDRLLTAREVAAYLGVHVNTVKRLSDRGELAFIRVVYRGDRRYRQFDLDRFLAERYVPRKRRRA